MTTFFRLAFVQFKISASQAMAYRGDFLLQGVMTAMWIALVLLPLEILYNGREVVADWKHDEALILMAYFIGLRGVLECVVSPSLTDLVERIRSGSFDYVLLKPVDAQIMVTASRYEPWKVFDIIGAIALLVYAFWLRGAPPALGDAVLGVVMFASGAIAMYSLWIVCAAAAFWVVRLDNLIYLLGSIFDIARWPVQIFPGTWRLIFTYVIPVALMTTFPAMAMLGKLGTNTALATIGGSLGLLVLSRLVWVAAIRNYTSASS
ncbi:MAG: ABC-2 family transporter protein [Kofleriaceae bacterium]